MEIRGIDLLQFLPEDVVPTGPFEDAFEQSPYIKVGATNHDGMTSSQTDALTRVFSGIQPVSHGEFR